MSFFHLLDNFQNSFKFRTYLQIFSFLKNYNSKIWVNTFMVHKMAGKLSCITLNIILSLILIRLVIV